MIHNDDEVIKLGVLALIITNFVAVIVLVIVCCWCCRNRNKKPLTGSVDRCDNLYHAPAISKLGSANESYTAAPGLHKDLEVSRNRENASVLSNMGSTPIPPPPARYVPPTT